MSQRVLTLTLIRDGQCTPWGFRMSGGADIGTPLLVQRVNLGTPSEGELQKGDIILSIGSQDARKMSHQKATDLIAKSGNNLKLMVMRSAGIPMEEHTRIVSPNPYGVPDQFKPLPTTDFHKEFRKDFRSTNFQEHQSDRNTIANQAYRTMPLITPDLKVNKDVPIGSYLRFTQDTSGRSNAAKNADPYMLTRVQEAILEAALSSPRASVSSSRTSTPDIGYQNFAIKPQYNSPINLYSHQALVETVNAQSSIASKSNIGLPRVQSPTQKEPMDIRKSATYQLIQEEEMKKKHVKKEAVETKVHDLHDFPKHGIEDYEDIHQSGSFKFLMSSLTSAPKI